MHPSIGWIMYGVVLCLFVQYIRAFFGRDHLVTKVWACLIMALTSAASFYQVYFDWIFSINTLSDIKFRRSVDSPVNGNVVVLYSSVVM